MNEADALARIEEKIADRLERLRAGTKSRHSDAYDVGVIAGTKLALEDVRVIRSLVEGGDDGEGGRKDSEG